MSLDSQPQDDIYLAHCVRGIPLSEIMIPYPSVRSLLVSQVRRYGKKPFLIYRDRDNGRTEISYNRFFSQASRTANFLESEGVLFGDRVAVPTGNSPETLVQYLGAWMMGAVAVPVQTSRKNWTDFNPSETRATPVFPENKQTFSDLLKEHSEEYRIGKKSKLDDDVLIIVESDNEKKRKRIVLSHYNLMVAAMATARWHGLSDDLPVICGAPVYEIAGMVGCVISALYAGATIVLSDLSDAELFLRTISSERGQVALVDSRMIALLSGHDIEINQFDFSSFRYFFSSHNSLTSQMVIETETRLGHQIIPGFCRPETASFSSFVPIGLSDERHWNWFRNKSGLPIGRSLHANEMGILSGEGELLSEEERGEIAVRGHNVMMRYLYDRAATREVFKYGWLRTGEEGYYCVGEDGEKYFFVSSDTGDLLLGA